MTEIKSKAVKCVNSISMQLDQLHWTEVETYATWLAQTYFYVRHATRVLTYAASHCSFEQEKLHMKLIHGVSEEQGHEILALRDLMALGYKIRQFPEFSETTAYYQTLYHNIRTEGPLSLLGYFVALEGLAAVGMAKMSNTVLTTFGDSKTEFVRMHCIVDKNHFNEGLIYLESLGSAEIPIIEKNMNLSTSLYIGTLKAIGQRAKEFKLIEDQKVA